MELHLGVAEEGLAPYLEVFCRPIHSDLQYGERAGGPVHSFSIVGELWPENFESETRTSPLDLHAPCSSPSTSRALR